MPTWRAVELAKRGCHTRLTLWHSRQPSRQRWDGQGRLRCSQGHSARHASMGGLFVLLPTAPPLEHDSLHTPSLPRECPPQHHSQPLTTEGKTLFPVLGDRGKGLLGKSCTHWFRNLAHTELHLFWFILLCSLRLTW